MNSLEDMAAQAQRHLDGSRVNVDRMAKNVLALVEMVRALQQQAHDAEPAPRSTVSASGPMASAIDDLLAEAFGEKN
jgi:hypothetical protein